VIIEMKKLGVLLGLLALIIVVASPVAAKGDVVLCRVEIGDDGSEAGHNLAGWGPVEPAAHPGNWGGILGTCRVIWDSSDDNPSATITLDRCESPGGAKLIRICHLDGLADDSFNVEVKDIYGNFVCIGSWAGTPGTENWLTSEFSLPKGKELQVERGEPIEVKLTATGPKWSGFDTYGQVAFDWIELAGSGKGKK
jgi:hypothetical protein